VSNQSLITELNDAKKAFLRESLSILVRNHGPQDIVSTLAIVMDDYAATYASRTGDTDGASSMKLIANHLDGLESYLDNYDGAPVE
jgi:hypothetical protein